MDIFNVSLPDFRTFIYFLLPGFIFIFLFFYQIPDRKKSDFKLIVWCFVTSGLINYSVDLLLQIFQITLPDWFFQGIAIGWSIVLALLLASFVKSKYFFLFNEKLLGIKYYPFGRVWNSFFEVDKVTIVRVTLHDGMGYIGQLKKASIDPDDEKQELEIFNIYAYDKGTGNYTRIKETESMLILGSSIATVEKITKDAAKSLYDF